MTTIKYLTYRLKNSIIKDRNIFMKVGGIMVVLLDEAKKQLNKLIEQVNVNSSEPITIVDEKSGHNAVLISEFEWNSMQETIYLLGIPGMAESLLKGSQEPLSECKKYVKGELW